MIHYRLQLSIFGAISLVYAVTGTQNGIYSKDGSYIAMAVGWLILAMVDVSALLLLNLQTDVDRWSGSSISRRRTAPSSATSWVATGVAAVTEALVALRR